MVNAQIIFDALEHLFFPALCAGCGRELIRGENPLCLRCEIQLPATSFHLQPDNPVEKIFWGRLPIVAASAHFYFSKQSALQELMHGFKYKGKKMIGQHFGRMMGQALNDTERFQSVDALVPLPLYSAREKKRGYNQARILCEGINETFKRPILDNLVKRNESTSTQTRKNRLSRWKNMEGKFYLSQPPPDQWHLLLVDDIITTGATLEACGSTLLQCPGIALSIATLAFTDRMAG